MARALPAASVAVLSPWRSLTRPRTSTIAEPPPGPWVFCVPSWFSMASICGLAVIDLRIDVVAHAVEKRRPPARWATCPPSHWAQRQFAPRCRASAGSGPRHWLALKGRDADAGKLAQPALDCPNEWAAKLAGGDRRVRSSRSRPARCSAASMSRERSDWQVGTRGRYDLRGQEPPARRARRAVSRPSRRRGSVASAILPPT